MKNYYRANGACINMDAMRHRHLNHERYTLAAIDDIILRGKWEDWVDLRRSLLTDHALMEKVKRVCQPHISDQYNQRHIFWIRYVEKHSSAA